MRRTYFYLISFSLLIISFFIDELIVDFFVTHRVTYLNEFFILLTNLTTIYVIFTLTLLLAIPLKKRKEWILQSWMSLFVALLVVGILKWVIGRERPDVEHLVENNSNSFPSGHSITVFSIFPVLEKYFLNISTYWFIIGILVMISRIYLGVHYPSDVISGMILGIFVGDVVLHFFKKYFLLRRKL